MLVRFRSKLIFRIESMIDNAAQFIEDVTHQHMNWINHYTIVSFTDKGYFPTCDSDDPNDFINGLKLLKTLTQQSGTSCNNLDILPMMYNAMQERYFTEGGLLFVFLNGVWKTELATYGDVLEISQVSKNPISFFQFSPTAPCGLQSSDNTLKLMQSLAIQTGGEYVQVQQKDAGSVLLSIASLYSSQLIYEAHQDDCSKALVNFYFPTESQTQSISVTFAGSLNGPPTYVKPSGDGKGALNNINVWNNYGISRQDLIIKACENDDWDSNGKQCYLTSTVPLTWIEAQQVCHQNKAVLTSILSKDTQDYLDSVDAHTDYWIGLNDKVKDGDWRWDTLGEYPAKLSGWTNWAPKQPSNSDTERCVFQQGSSSRKWVAADCGQKKPFVCVKHAYDFNYQPHDVTKVHLPRGMWKASVQTFNGPCAIQVRAQSGIRLYTVYTTDVHDDYGMPELADGKKVKNYIAAKVTGLESANPQMPLGNLDFAQMFYNDNMQMVLAEPFKRRSKCAYDYISHDFPCPAASFQITVSGIDSIGFPFQRIIPAMCFPRNTAKQCDNGGVWDKTRAECVCVPGFFGDKCEFAICAPHGNIGAGLSDCICDVGWTGSHCELPMCPGNQTETEDPFLQDTRKSFMVIMDGCNSGVQGDVISKFPDIINAVIAKASDLQDAWFTSFIGIVFRTTASKVPVSPIIKASNVSMFIKRMQDELNINKDTCEMTTDRQMMLALTDIMNEPTVALTPRSQAFLITNGVAGDYAQARPAMDAIAVSHTAVSIISTVGKTMPLASLSDPKIASMTSVAHDSGGAFYQIPDEPTLKKLLTADIGTLFESYHLSSLARKECSGLQEYVQVGGDTKMLVFDIFAQKTPVIHLYDPLNNKVDVTQVVSTATNSFFTVKNEKLPPGLWRVGIDNSDKNMGYCEVNIRGHSEEEIFLAFTQDTGNDNGYTSNIVNYFPQHGFDNAVIAATSFGTMTYAQILTNDERRLLWAAPMIKRSNCAYDYISKCNRVLIALVLTTSQTQNRQLIPAVTPHEFLQRSSNLMIDVPLSAVGFLLPYREKRERRFPLH
ncbi:hypothetical protein L596_029706 [Steinernema carpocapsae]|uniref:C-type lectin domain-containing protein n=1 Tax=Steinernema carpocapsae TaxID=34508 RepID=A0A4U5LQK1_STECR|nr:hypothetical protein L596_029706 [Steinernema carpocapsae]